MIKVIKFYALSMAIVFFAGCSTASLLPADFKITDENSRQGRVMLLSSMQKRDPENSWADFKIMKVIATDVWRSAAARYSTPIPEASQQIQFAFNLKDEDVAAKFLTGKKVGNVFGIADDKTYLIKKGVRFQEDSQKVRGYLSSARNYFLWPQIFHNYDNIAYLGQTRLRYSTYYKVVVNRGPEDAGQDESQYIVWVNQETLNIDYIEFALGDLAKSSGVVHYRDYRFVGGIKLPHQIVLLDAIGKKNFSHKFHIEIYSLE